MGQGGDGFSLETMSGHENGPAGSSGLARACGLEQAHRRASYVTVKPAMTFQTLPTPFPSPGLYFYFLAGSENSLRSERGTEKVRESLRKCEREGESCICRFFDMLCLFRHPLWSTFKEQLS